METKDEATIEQEENGTLEQEESVESVSELEQLQSDYAALNDRYVRTLAEYDNFRKRTQKDIESKIVYTKTDILGRILPVLDNFERAAFNSDADFDSYKKGIEMTVTQLMEIFKGLGVESFGEPGDKFDPNIHNGVMHIEDEAYGEDEIVEVFMKGYRMGDKIIRPATVKVAN